MKNPRLVKSCYTRNLPEDLWPDILSRLPVKSLVRFRCVSKPWLAMIGDPDLARLHLLRSNNNRHETHLLLRARWLTEFAIRSTKTLSLTATLCFPLTITDQSSIKHWIVVSSVDGLFMLEGWGRGLSKLCIMWNPSIRKTLILPQLSIGMKSLEFGLGFDPLTKDYKCVRLVLNDGTRPQSLAIYSVGTNSWKTIEFQADRCSTRWLRCFCNAYYKPQNMFLRGFVCAIAMVTETHGDLSEPFEFVSLDLSSDAFATIKVPVEQSSYFHNASLAMVDDGSSPAVINFCSKTRSGSIWVLEGFGGNITSWNWSKRHTFAVRSPLYGFGAGRSEFFCLGKDGKMLFMWERMVTSYDLETHEEKILLTKDFDCSNTWPYVESLLLLK